MDHTVFRFQSPHSGHFHSSVCRALFHEGILPETAATIERRPGAHNLEMRHPATNNRTPLLQIASIDEPQTELRRGYLPQFDPLVGFPAGTTIFLECFFIFRQGGTVVALVPPALFRGHPESRKPQHCPRPARRSLTSVLRAATYHF